MSGVCGAAHRVSHHPYFQRQSSILHPAISSERKKVTLATRDHYKIFSTTTVPDRKGIDTAAAEKQAPLGLSLEGDFVPCGTGPPVVGLDRMCYLLARERDAHSHGRSALIFQQHVCNYDSGKISMAR
jgi:hypothetical protein